MKAIFLTSVLFCMSTLSFAHKSKVTEKTYNNIHAVIYTNEFTENINTALITSLYAEKLSKELGYSKTITIYFEESYYEENVVFSQIDNLKGKNELLIKFKAKDFNVAQSLNVIRYSILNVKKLSEDVNFYKGLYFKNDFSAIDNLLKNRIDRPKEVKELERQDKFNYYFQNGKYNFYEKDTVEKKITEFSHIDDFFIVDYITFMVFTKNNEITFIHQNKIKQLKLENAGELYFPYKIKFLGNKIFLNQDTSEWKDNRVAVYDIDKDILIQNLDELIK